MEREKQGCRRIFLSVAYDGTNYHGWQFQPGAVTIEGELNRALSELLQEKIQVIGASRTDAGVHALCNAAVFDTTARIPAEKFAYALNQRLPEDIRVRESKEAASDFHPRHVQSRKTYEYRIYNARFPMPAKRLYSFFTYAKLDVEAMARAGALLEGEHDFKSFCSVNTQAKTTIRTIYRVEVWRERADGILPGDRESFGPKGSYQGNSEDSDIVIRVTGNGFLYNMVRIIAGTLLEVGQGKRKPEEITAILKARDRSAAGSTAPACGLTLTAYEFEECVSLK
ncbi:MAG: tRNA pseudouridine(38-40) synthase TruA [Clostridium sp.]|nr:tRNA pseudouridine(38-40) synthase TruA [Clostridium sp.]